MTVSITAFPYAVAEGTIEIPDGLKEDEIRSYVDDHFDDISFGEPDLDFAGTEYEVDAD